MNASELTPQLFLLLSDLVSARAGLHHALADRDIFAAKLELCLSEAGFESPLDYYYYLRYDDDTGTELTRLIETLTVHETYLFREAHALRVVADELAGRAAHRPTVWSAACSTGEEPLSLAMLLASRNVLGAVRVVASDVSNRAVERARSGRLGRRAIRSDLPPMMCERWLRPAGPGWTVDPELLNAIRWEQANLVSEPDVRRIGAAPFDIVLLRNVLIYFDDDTVRRVIRNVRQVLRPGGIVVVGASESLMRLGTGLELEELRGAFVYRSPGNT